MQWTLCCATLLLCAGTCLSVHVDRVELASNSSTAALQSETPTVLVCWYRLEVEEQLEEVVWVRGGRLLQSISPDGTEVPEVLLQSQFEVSPLNKSSAGMYSCTARTTVGDAHTRKFELIVVDIPVAKYSYHQELKSCVYHISMKTAPAYPEGTAFCGIWVNMTADGEQGYWLEPPPVPTMDSASASHDHDHAMHTSSSKLSYSTERHEWRRIVHEEDRVSFELDDATINVKDTPELSYGKCFSGYYKQSGEIVPLAEFISYNSVPQQPYVECSANTLPPYSSQHVSLEYSSHTDTCRGNIAATSFLGLEATLRCVISGQTRVVLCDDGEWVIRTDGGDKVDLQDNLEDFVETCEDDSGNAASRADGLSALLTTLALLAVRTWRP